MYQRPEINIKKDGREGNLRANNFVENCNEFFLKEKTKLTIKLYHFSLKTSSPVLFSGAILSLAVHRK